MHELRVVDGRGRAASQKLAVHTLPRNASLLKKAGLRYARSRSFSGVFRDEVFCPGRM